MGPAAFGAGICALVPPGGHKGRRHCLRELARSQPWSAGPADRLQQGKRWVQLLACEWAGAKQGSGDPAESSRGRILHRRAAAAVGCPQPLPRVWQCSQAGQRRLAGRQGQ